MNRPPVDEDFENSRVRIKLVDPTGRAIGKLKYQVKQGKKTVMQGETDQDGRIKEFLSRIGAPLSINVERFTTKDMKCIREVTPWTEIFSIILVSGKVKEKMPLKPDKGDAGSYRRKTYTVRAGDTLGAIARCNGTTAKEIAALNNMEVEAIIHPGQILKLPALEQAGTASKTVPPPAGKKPQPQPESRHPPISSMPPVPSKEEKPVPTQKVLSPEENKNPTAADTQTTQSRGENGSPKTTASLTCPGACIKVGDKGPLVEEINIRLMGFGGTISAPSPLDVFTKKTEAAVKQFQRDYMGTKETGKVCGAFVAALDDFREKYPIDFSTMLCNCGLCSGFGNSLKDSTSVEIFKDKDKKTPFPGIEYPGIHRSLFWALRAALFYTHTCDKKLDYCFMRISSGYRCWHNNAGYQGGKIKGRTYTTYNHMGNAFDLQFRKGDSKIRCQDKEIEFLRQEIFVKRLGAKMDWKEINVLSLEPARQSNGKPGATAWIHMDVRQFEGDYLISRYYATNQGAADGSPLFKIAFLEKRLPLLACGGINPSTQTNENRRDMTSLSISDKGIEFIKGWEKCKLTLYNDKRNHCTIGWGHLVSSQRCEDIKDKSITEPYEKGISQKSADELFAEDIEVHEKIVKKHVQVPMLQNEYDALVSLIFNIGRFEKCPKLLSKLNTKDYAGCCDEFSDITNDNDEGLAKRRMAEINMFRHNVYNHSH